jgi:hypothetical protein
LSGAGLRVVGLVALAAGLFALTAATASAAPRTATMFVHSAKGGQLGGSRLVLRGVGPRVTWISNRGRSGVVSIKRLHRRLFLPGTPSPVGILHVAGRRGGDELRLKLRRPRYNASRRTVSYRVTRLNKGRPPRQRALASGPRRFGSASLSIVGAPQVLGGTGGGNDCVTDLYDDSSQPFEFKVVSFSKWDTDDWGLVNIAPGDTVFGGGWESIGGTLRGCGNSANFDIVPSPYSPNPYTGGGRISISTTWPWGQLPSSNCTSSNPQLSCTRLSGPGVITWQVQLASP